jgi:hypothetical protein
VRSVSSQRSRWQKYFVKRFMSKLESFISRKWIAAHDELNDTAQILFNAHYL